MGWGFDLGPCGEQLAQTARSPRAAQQIAIDLGQRAEGAGDEPAGQHEGGDRAARHPARGDVQRTLPQHHRNRAEHQADHQRGHHRAERDAALGGGEHILDRVAEAAGLALFLPERLDDLHRAQHFGGESANIGDAILRSARETAHAAAEQDQRQQHQRYDDDHEPGELGAQHEQIGDAADQREDVAQRDRDGGADHLLDQRGIRGKPGGDLGRAILLEEAWG